ncbi:unnamed protein product, partial [Ectocarpus sp. 12 AP-2014]
RLAKSSADGSGFIELSGGTAGQRSTAFSLPARSSSGGCCAARSRRHAPPSGSGRIGGDAANFVANSRPFGRCCKPFGQCLILFRVSGGTTAREVAGRIVF